MERPDDRASSAHRAVVREAGSTVVASDGSAPASLVDSPLSASRLSLWGAVEEEVGLLSGLMKQFSNIFRNTALCRIPADSSLLNSASCLRPISTVPDAARALCEMRCAAWARAQEPAAPDDRSVHRDKSLRVPLRRPCSPPRTPADAPVRRARGRADVERLPGGLVSGDGQGRAHPAPCARACHESAFTAKDAHGDILANSIACPIMGWCRERTYSLAVPQLRCRGY